MGIAFGQVWFCVTVQQLLWQKNERESKVVYTSSILRTVAFVFAIRNLALIKTAEWRGTNKCVKQGKRTWPAQCSFQSVFEVGQPSRGILFKSSLFTKILSKSFGHFNCYEYGSFPIFHRLIPNLHFWRPTKVFCSFEASFE